MIKVLFVCLGNICRSPLAEAIFNHKINQKGLKSAVIADSSGTSNYHIGEAPDPRTIEIAEKNNIKIHHFGQQFKKKHADEFDYLVAMDASNRQNMIREIGSEPDFLYQMRTFDDIGKGGDVPDPYYGGADGFQKMYEILDRSCENLLQFIIKKHHLQ
ncbi:MAG: low molecular weight protein-tyrosine-phosphatase [Bacteroidota bacterium]